MAHNREREAAPTTAPTRQRRHRHARCRCRRPVCSIADAIACQCHARLCCRLSCRARALVRCAPHLDLPSASPPPRKSPRLSRTAQPTAIAAAWPAPPPAQRSLGSTLTHFGPQQYSIIKSKLCTFCFFSRGTAWNECTAAASGGPRLPSVSTSMVTIPARLPPVPRPSATRGDGVLGPGRTSQRSRHHRSSCVW
jgi:hypothetical protein